MNPDEKFNSLAESTKEDFWTEIDEKVKPVKGIVVCSIGDFDITNLSAKSIKVIYRDVDINWEKIGTIVGSEEVKTLKNDWQQDLASLKYLVLLYHEASYITCISA